ncbi:hypothetical protein Bbelb_174610 [Branchiostoma belcheri]|nr:hypothetical protein Bbelb_174610 [Branchiostoma belcheri]
MGENSVSNSNLEENQCAFTEACSKKEDEKDILPGKYEDGLDVEVAKRPRSLQSTPDYSKHSNEAFKQEPQCNNVSVAVQADGDEMIQMGEIKETSSAGTQTELNSEWSADISIQTNQTEWLRDFSVQASSVVHSMHTQTSADEQKSHSTSEPQVQVVGCQTDLPALVGAPVASRNAGVQVMNDYWSSEQGTQTTPQTSGHSVPCQTAFMDTDTKDTGRTSSDTDNGPAPPHSQVAEPRMSTAAGAELPSVDKREEKHTVCCYDRRADEILSQHSDRNSESIRNIDPDGETSELHLPRVIPIVSPPPAGWPVDGSDLPRLLEAYRILYNHYVAFPTEGTSSGTRTVLSVGHAAVTVSETKEDTSTAKPPPVSTAKMSYINGIGETVDVCKSSRKEHCDGIEGNLVPDTEDGWDGAPIPTNDELARKESDCTMVNDSEVSEDPVDFFCLSDTLHEGKCATNVLHSGDNQVDSKTTKMLLKDGNESPGISSLDAAEVLFAMSKNVQKSSNKDLYNDMMDDDGGCEGVKFHGCCQTEYPAGDFSCPDSYIEGKTEPFVEIQHSSDQSQESGNLDTAICEASVFSMKFGPEEEVFGTVCGVTPSLSPKTPVQDKPLCLQPERNQALCQAPVSEPDTFAEMTPEKEYDQSFTVTTRQQWKNFVSAMQVQTRPKKESVEVDRTKFRDSLKQGKEEEETESLESKEKSSYQSERNIQPSSKNSRPLSDNKIQTGKAGPTGVRSSYTCQICKKKFKSYARFFYHLRHSVKCTKAGKQRLGQTKYVCRMCEGQYATNKGYEKHGCFKERMLRPRIRRVSYNEDSYPESDVNTSASQDNQCADGEDVKFETEFPLTEITEISKASQTHHESCESKALASECMANLIDSADGIGKEQSSDRNLKTEIVSTIVKMFVDDPQPDCPSKTGDIDNIQLEPLPRDVHSDPNHNTDGLITKEGSRETYAVAQTVQEYSDEMFRRELQVLADGLVDSWLGETTCDTHQCSPGGSVYGNVSLVGMDHTYSAQVTAVTPTQVLPPTVAMDMLTAAVTVPKE